MPAHLMIGWEFSFLLFTFFFFTVDFYSPNRSYFCIYPGTQVSWVTWHTQFNIIDSVFSYFSPIFKNPFQSFMALVVLHDNSYHCAPTVLWGAHN